MRARRFAAHVAAGPGGRGVIAVPFDPDKVWGAKAGHPVGGAINGRHVRGTIAPDGSGWAEVVELLATGIKQRPRVPQQSTKTARPE